MSRYPESQRLSAALTADLSVEPNIDPKELEDVRRASAQSYLSGQRSHFFAESLLSDVQSLNNETMERHQEKITELSNDPEPPLPLRLCRRLLSSVSLPFPRIEPTAVSGQSLKRSFGPFRDKLNRPVVIDAIQPLSLTALQREGANTPFLYGTLPPSTSSGNQITLGPGSVWIPIEQLVGLGPLSSFVGLRIQRGTIIFTEGIQLDPVLISVPVGMPVQVELTLNPEPTTASPPSHRNSTVTTPLTVSFTFLDSGATLTAAADSGLVFGTSVGFTFQNGPARFDSMFSRVEFPLTASATRITVSSNSLFASLFGAASITDAAWSLPITTTAANSLSDAKGAGGLSLRLGEGLSIAISDLDITVDCRLCLLVVEPSGVLLGGATARASSLVAQLPLSAKSNLRILMANAFQFVYESTSERELWAIAATLVNMLDQPRTINDERAYSEGQGALALLKEKGVKTLIVRGNRNSNSIAKSYAIKNLLMGASDPSAFTIVGTYDAGHFTGAISLQLELFFVVPFLPDPYTHNMPLEPARFDGPRNMMFTVHLKDDKIGMVDVTLPSDALSLISTCQTESIRKSTASISSKLLRPSSTFPEIPILPTMLDLSSNASQFGVIFGPFLQDAPPVPVSVSNLFMELPFSEIAVFTLPTVQWEPVLTPDLNLISPLLFANSGPPTIFATASVASTPVAPLEAMAGVIGEYGANPPQAIAAFFTLPFGIKALAALFPSLDPGIAVPEVGQTRPKFSKELTGGYQISIRGIPSSDGTVLTPFLPGFALQEKVGRSRNGPVNDTVITPLDDVFNSTFGPDGETPLVPVTRIDVSGYGESLFSDWRATSENPAFISKVEFNVLLGRTSREVVQLVTQLMPYCVRTVVTVLTERLNSGTVVRRKVNLQPCSDGRYQFPKAVIVTHPGVVRGVSNVTNIRDLDKFTAVDNVDWLPVRFDCMVDMEGVISGAGDLGVPARDQLGYVLLSTDLTASQYAALLDKVGPLGGQIDCTIRIADTAQKMRISRIGVGHTNGQFAMAARGAPVLPGGGQWSFLVASNTDLAPSLIKNDAVPLTREGRAGEPILTTNPYRFAEPSDLLTPDSPTTIYGLCHATGTQRVLFVRPVIQATDPPALTSNHAPYIADPFILATSTGPFPRFELCLRFNDDNFQLLIKPDGNLKLVLPSNQFTLPVTRRVTSENHNYRGTIVTEAENGASSEVTITIDTASPTPWSFTLTNLSVVSEIPAMSTGTKSGVVSQVVGIIKGHPGNPTEFTDTRFIFGPVLEPVAKSLAFLEKFGLIPPLSVAMGNEWALKASVLANKQRFKEFYPSIAEFLDKFFEELNLEIEHNIQAQSTSGDMKLDVKVMFGEGWVFKIVGKFELHLGTDGITYVLGLGGGGGIGFKLLDLFDATGTFDLTIIGVRGSHTWGLGGALTISLEVKLGPVTAGVFSELRHIWFWTDCQNHGHPDETRWALTQATIGIEVHIFFVIGIEFTWTAEWKEKHNNGSCEMNFLEEGGSATPN